MCQKTIKFCIIYLDDHDDPALSTTNTSQSTTILAPSLTESILIPSLAEPIFILIPGGGYAWTRKYLDGQLASPVTIQNDQMTQELASQLDDDPALSTYTYQVYYVAVVPSLFPPGQGYLAT